MPPVSPTHCHTTLPCQAQDSVSQEGKSPLTPSPCPEVAALHRCCPGTPGTPGTPHRRAGDAPRCCTPGCENRRDRGWWPGRCCHLVPRHGGDTGTGTGDRGEHRDRHRDQGKHRDRQRGSRAALGLFAGVGGSTDRRVGGQLQDRQRGRELCRDSRSSPRPVGTHRDQETAGCCRSRCRLRTGTGPDTSTEGTGTGNGRE